MLNDQRMQKRNSEPADMQVGNIYNCRDSECFDVQMVKDISSDGITLKSDAYFEEGTAVHLKLKRKEEVYQVYGHVVWAAPVGKTSDAEQSGLFYWLGISLDD